MGFGAAVSSCFNKYATFSGRAPRSEYWWWMLFMGLAGLGLAVIGFVLFAVTKRLAPAGIILGLFYLGTLLPGISVTVRRLHDLNRSGWWYGALFILIFFSLAMSLPVSFRSIENVHAGLPARQGIPAAAFAIMHLLDLGQFLYSLLLFVWYCMRGTRGPNRFGDDPLRVF